MIDLLQLDPTPTNQSPAKNPVEKSAPWNRFPDCEECFVIHEGALNGTLLPHEAAIKLGISGRIVADLLRRLDVAIPPCPSSVPSWARTTPLTQWSGKKTRALARKEQIEFQLDFSVPAPKNVPAKTKRTDWSHIDTTQRLSVENERILIKAYQNGDRDAGGVIIMAHQGLIVSMAKKHVHLGCPLEDLVAEANMGMCEAILKFREEGARLSTYAVWWIRQYLRKALTENCRIIRIPTCQQQAVREIHATAARLTEITGSYPSDEEIAHECGMTTLKVQTLRNLTVPMISLQSTVGGDAGDTRTYEDILSDQTGAAESPLDSLTRKNGKESILAIIKRRLNPKEQTVVVGRFGLNGDPQTLEEVGKTMGLTRERVRQIQEAALKKLKRSLMAEQSQETTLLAIPRFIGV